MAAPYDARSVANFFLEKEQLTQMQLHKLVYFAHGWYLGFTGTPLIDDIIEAWQYGPVVPSLYRMFWTFGATPITLQAFSYNRATGRLTIVAPVPESDEGAHGLLERIWEVYGSYSAGQLSALTHKKGSPWARVRKRNPNSFSRRIRNSLIRKHFEKRIEEQRAKQNS